MSDARDYWEAKYSDADRVWSGRPNATFADAVAWLTPGRALDLGCGEGADAVWLAGRGWYVTAVDISPTALARGAAAADAEGVPGERLAWVAADLAEWEPEGPYDLVTSAFLHSPVDFPRLDVLARAAAAVGPGGTLVLLTHAEPPPWRRAHQGEGHDHRQASPAEDVAALRLDGPDWELVTAEVRDREAVAPDGEPAVLRDGLVVARRR